LPWLDAPFGVAVGSDASYEQDIAAYVTGGVLQSFAGDTPQVVTILQVGGLEAFCEASILANPEADTRASKAESGGGLRDITDRGIEEEESVLASLDLSDDGILVNSSGSLMHHAARVAQRREAGN
jgi:hypothetical protein